MTTKLEKAKLLGRALRGIHYPKRPLTGWGSYGDTTKATLYIGATTGLRGARPEGAKLTEANVITTTVGLRAGQIGPHAGMTASIARGQYKGHPETSYKVEFFHDGSEPSPKKFVSNIKQLAQGAACSGHENGRRIGGA